VWPTTFCDGDSVTLTSNSASGNQWYLDGNPIAGATNQTYVANASGNYTDQVTTLSCAGAPSPSISITVKPIPPAPIITASGTATFLRQRQRHPETRSSASGNQWFLNGNPIAGATNQTYIANASGDYTVTVTDSGCTSPASAATTVTVRPFGLTVINANDSGAGSLRQAIADICDGGTISFNLGAGPHTIVLDTELSIAASVTIANTLSDTNGH
jgi:membrane carboxypeptidase/penicillin-binding protein PbpC